MTAPTPESQGHSGRTRSSMPASFAAAARACLGTGLVAAMAVVASGQSEVPRLLHDQSLERIPEAARYEVDGILFGWKVCTLSDIDGDGVRDWAVGVPGAWIDGEARGCVLFLSGSDQRVLKRIDGEMGNDWFGSSIQNVGDLDGDGIDDLAIGMFDFLMSQKARVTLVSGSDGKVLKQIPGYARAVGRVDHPQHGPRLLLSGFHVEFEPKFGLVAASKSSLDSKEPVEVVQEWRPGEGSRVVPVTDEAGRVGSQVILYRERPTESIRLTEAHDLDSGSVLAIPDCGRESLAARPAVAQRADFDQDGTPDVAVSLAACNSDFGTVVMYSGRSGKPMLELGLLTKPRPPLARGRQFGGSMVLVGDIDGDRHTDLIVAANHGIPDSGALYAYSGTDGRMFWSRSGDTLINLGTSMDVLDDLDGDGVREVLVGCVYNQFTGRFYANGSLRVFSGKTGKQLTIVYEQDFPELAAPRPAKKEGK